MGGGGGRGYLSRVVGVVGVFEYSRLCMTGETGNLAIS